MQLFNTTLDCTLEFIEPWHDTWKLALAILIDKLLQLADEKAIRVLLALQKLLNACFDAVHLLLGESFLDFFAVSLQAIQKSLRSPFAQLSETQHAISHLLAKILAPVVEIPGLGILVAENLLL